MLNHWKIKIRTLHWWCSRRYLNVFHQFLNTCSQIWGRVINQMHYYYRLTIISGLVLLEFVNKKLQEFFKSKNVIWYTTNGKSSIVERANATLMSKLIRLFNHKNSNTYIKDLQHIVSNYNNTKHRSTGFSPNSINSENQVRSLLTWKLQAFSNNQISSWYLETYTKICWKTLPKNQNPSSK